MKKLLKIGIPILVAVLVLIIGTGVVLANNDAPVLTGSRASYDDGYSRFPMAGYGPGGCPMAGYGPGGCPMAGNGPGGWSGDNDANYQPPCHRYGR